MPPTGPTVARPPLNPTFRLDAPHIDYDDILVAERGTLEAKVIASRWPALLQRSHYTDVEQSWSA